MPCIPLQSHTFWRLSAISLGVLHHYHILRILPDALSLLSAQHAYPQFLVDMTSNFLILTKIFRVLLSTMQTQYLLPDSISEYGPLVSIYKHSPIFLAAVAVNFRTPFAFVFGLQQPSHLTKFHVSLIPNLLNVTHSSFSLRDHRIREPH